MSDPVLVQDVNNPTWSSPFSLTSAALGSTPTQGNLLWASLWLATGTSNPGVTTPTGWTLLKEFTNNDTSDGIYYRVAGASEPTSWQWTWTQFASQVNVYVAEWGPNDTSTPIDASDAAWHDFGDNPSSPIAIPSLTTVTNGAVHIITVNNDDHNTGQFTAPSGYTENEDAHAIGTFSKVIATAGATGAQNVGITGTFGYRSYSFAIRPVAAAGGGPFPFHLQRVQHGGMPGGGLI